MKKHNKYIGPKEYKTGNWHLLEEIAAITKIDY